MNTLASPKSVHGAAKTEELERYSGIKGDKRRELLDRWGLQSRSAITWIEIWSATGLEADQPRELWADLQTPLLDNKEVSQITGISVYTINAGRRKDNYPTLFPNPSDLAQL